MADLRIALLDLKEESDSGRATAPAASVAPAGARGRGSVGVAVAIMAAPHGGSAFQGPPQMPVPRALTFDSGVAVFPPISRDGKLAGLRERPRRWNEPDIWVQQMTAGRRYGSRDIPPTTANRTSHRTARASPSPPRETAAVST
jgi:hypothetical protein